MSIRLNSSRPPSSACPRIHLPLGDKENTFALKLLSVARIPMLKLIQGLLHRPREWTRRSSSLLPKYICGPLCVCMCVLCFIKLDHCLEDLSFRVKNHIFTYLVFKQINKTPRHQTQPPALLHLSFLLRSLNTIATTVSISSPARQKIHHSSNS